MKVDQYAVDWKEDWDFKEIAKFARGVGGKKALQEHSQGIVDAKVMYISSRQLTYKEMDELWDAVELWGFNGPIEGRTFKDILKKVKDQNRLTLMTEDLASEMEQSKKLWKMKPAQIAKLYKERFGNKEPGA